MPTKTTIIKLILALSGVLFLGLGCQPRVQEVEEIEHVSLTYWQVWQNSFDVQPLIQEYQRTYPNVSINFRNLRFEEYEEEMLKALAEDRGPDIFSIPMSWVGLYRNVIIPAPEEVTVQRVIMREPRIGELKPSVERIYNETVPIIRPRDVKRNYYSFVREDVLEEGESSFDGSSGDAILALPLYIDALALYYNKDILEENDIFEPPETWERFQRDVITIAEVEGSNTIQQPAAGIGTVGNMVRPTDVLVALMIQTGVQMVDEEAGFATFHQSVRNEDNYNAGLEALRFYTDFSDATKKVFTWNEDEDPALEQFKQGRLAYFFGYNYNLPEIRNSKVDFGVAPIPRPRDAIGAVTVANYWVETVSKKSQNTDQAWHFLNFLSETHNLQSLQDSTGNISPIKEHVTLIQDSRVRVFATAAANAEVWYHGTNAPEAEKALEEMITTVVNGQRSLEEAITFGAQQVTRTLR